MASSWHFDLASADANSAVPLPAGFAHAPFMIADSSAKQKSDLATEQPDLNKLKAKRAMQVAKQPGQQLMMTAMMLFMSGSGVHIFSIMITGMAILNPIKALFAVNSTFTQFDDGTIDLTPAKLTFLAINLGGLCMALYKCSSMGLLPVHSSDWIDMLHLKEASELSAGGMSL